MDFLNKVLRNLSLNAIQWCTVPEPARMWSLYYDYRFFLEKNGKQEDSCRFWEKGININ